MDKAAVFVLLSLSLTATLLFTGGEACHGAPSLSAVHACKQASTGPAMSKICKAALGATTRPQEVTNHVLHAVNAAARSYDATQQTISGMVQDPTVRGAMAEASLACSDRYGEARPLLTAVADHLRSCWFPELIQDITPAITAVDDCATAVLRAQGSSAPLYAMAVGDRDRSMLVLRLTSILLKNAPAE